MDAPKDFDDYARRFPAAIQALLQEMRQTIGRAVPSAAETISYKMPAFRRNDVVICFAGYANHIGFYPGAAAIAHFRRELAAYKSAKGSVQFPVTRPLPHELIAQIVKYRMNE